MRPLSLTRRQILLGVLAAVLVLGTVVIAVLPIVIRSVAVDRLVKLTGRPVALADVDLNLFTRRLVLRKFRLGQKTGPAAALAFERLEVKLGFLPLLRGEILVQELTLETPTIRVTRTDSGTFDFDDLLALIPPADPSKPKAKSTQIVSVGALAVRGLTVVARDLAVTPAAEWRVEGLTLEARNLTTRAGAAPGQVGASLKLNGTAIALKDGAVGLTLAVERSETALTRLAASGNVGLEDFRAVRRDATEPFVTLPKLAVAIREADLVKRVFTLASVDIVGLDGRVTRDPQGRLDALNLVSASRAVAAPAPGTPAEPLAVTLESITLRGARLAFADQTVTPAVTLAASDVTATVRDLTWPNTRPLTFDVAFGLPVSGRIAAKGRATLQPLDVDVTSSMRDGALSPYQPYLPIKARLDARFSAESRSRILTKDGRVTIASKGKSSIDDLSIRDPDAAADARPPVKIERIELAGIDFAWPGRARANTITITKPEFQLERNQDGMINLRDLFGPPGTPPASPAAQAPAATPPATAPPDAAPAAPPLAVTLGSVSLRDARLAFADRTVTPAVTLAATDVTATLRDVTWPNTRPLTFDVAFGLPTSGRITAQGQGTLQPLDVQITSSMRDGALSPYQPYLPIKARLDARLSADSYSRIATKDGRVTVASKGRSSIDALVVRDPDAAADARPPVKIERIDLAGIDFAWPGHARAGAITITKPDLQLERDQDGVINLRDLFSPPGTPPARPIAHAPAGTPPAPAAPPATAPPVKAAQAKRFENPGNAVAAKLPLALDFGTIALVDGYARFLDRSTDPGFSETLERLNVTIEGLSSTPGKRAKLTAQSVVGGAATLGVTGEIAPFGDLYADLTVELHDYVLASVNPYADSTIAWVIRRGKLQAKFHYRIDKDQVTATNDVVLGGLEVRRTHESDAVKRRIGLPLGLIVSLIKNSDGEIRINVPISGSLSDPKFDLNDTIWTAVKNVLVNVLASPFRAIGRLFSGSGSDKIEEPKINPIAFVPGSAALSDEMQKHLTQVANFLRRSPYVKLDLIPVGTPRDAAALKAQALTLRIEALQREKKLKDFNDAVTEAFREKFPGASSPKAPEEQLVRLLEAEPAADAHVPQLLRRRMAAVRDALVKGEDIPATRLVSRDPVRAAGADEPARVDLHLSDAE